MNHVKAQVLRTFGRLIGVATRAERELAGASNGSGAGMLDGFANFLSPASFTAETVAVAALSCCWRGSFNPLGAWTALEPRSLRGCYIVNLLRVSHCASEVTYIRWMRTVVELIFVIIVS